MKRSGLFAVISYLLLLSTSSQATTPIITVWSYYLAPPFKVSKTEGLAQDLVTLLNKEAGGRYLFKLSLIPRARLNRYLKQDRQGIVLFVNPAWIEPHAKTEYLWSPKLLQDQNEVISSAGKKVVYNGPESLKGMIFGAVRERKYQDLEALFLSGEIQRFDVNTEKQVLNLITLDRADVTTQPRIIVTALLKEMNIKDKIFISPTPYSRYTRHIMTTPELEDVHTLLTEIINSLDSNAHWSVILNKYGLSR